MTRLDTRVTEALVITSQIRVLLRSRASMQFQLRFLRITMNLLARGYDGRSSWPPPEVYCLYRLHLIRHPPWTKARARHTN